LKEQDNYRPEHSQEDQEKNNVRSESQGTTTSAFSSEAIAEEPDSSNFDYPMTMPGAETNAAYNSKADNAGDAVNAEQVATVSRANDQEEVEPDQSLAMSNYRTTGNPSPEDELPSDTIS